MLAVLVTLIGNSARNCWPPPCCVLLLLPGNGAPIFFGGTLFTAIANTATKHFFARIRPEVLPTH
jgi:undecaprenyl-diphosphatase